VKVWSASRVIWREYVRPAHDALAHVPTHAGPCAGFTGSRWTEAVSVASCASAEGNEGGG
jgi:hypothetical protein